MCLSIVVGKHIEEKERETHIEGTGDVGAVDEDHPVLHGAGYQGTRLH